jgi:hypothetical protein
MSSNLELNRERQRRWYALHKKEKNLINKQKYWNLRNLGLCPTCSGKNEAEKGKALCKECQEKRNKK